MTSPPTAAQIEEIRARHIEDTLHTTDPADDAERMLQCFADRATLLAALARKQGVPSEEEIAMKMVNPWVSLSIETCRAQSEWHHYLDIAKAIRSLLLGESKEGRE